MNKPSAIIFSLIIAAASVSSSSAASDPFDGAWLWAGKHDFFELFLVQDGAKLKGTHAATYDDGRRVDTHEDPETAGPSLVGKITGGVAEVTITSAYSGKTGTARITMTPTGLRWSVQKRPDGEFYFPMQALLKRDKDKVPKIADEPDAYTKSSQAAALAREALEEGRLDEAVALFDKSLQFNPLSTYVIEEKADVLVKLNRFDQALALYCAALTKRDKDRNLLLKKGECNLNLARYEEAVDDFTNAIKVIEAVKPREHQPPYLLFACYQNRASAYAQLGKIDLAEQDRLKAQSVNSLLEVR
ncbi:MAG: tetratricopeptide repeat protein [Candidatus Obscuribacterales bacterium]|nr:tetratricopeptide repeat protein [Candidatus Obscuribacterales bacterium]